MLQLFEGILLTSTFITLDSEFCSKRQLSEIIERIPVGTMVHNVELYLKHGGQMVRSAGTGAQVMAKEDNEEKKEEVKKEEPKKYKTAITNKINKLSNEQKRGIRSIISDNCLLEQNSESKVMKVDVNKIPFKQLKQLEKYVNKCIKENNKNNNLSLINNESYGESNLNLNKLGYSKMALIEEEKEIDILKNDDLSSCLSDDEDEEDE